MEHRGVRYDIKVALGRNQWIWVAHISPKPRQGSIEGPRRLAVAAAEKAIERWWKQRYGPNAGRVTKTIHRRQNERQCSLIWERE